MEPTQVVIIGGGATGAGILWDLSLRGISATLLEQGDIANGATGRCHGLLHSGGRYAVKDPDTARECVAESRIIKAIAPHCVDDVGGLFVQCAQDDPAFFDQWWRAAEEAGIRSHRLSADEARELEPNLATNILGAFTCPDAHVDVFRLVLANLEAAVARGGRFQTYSEVTSIHTANGRVRGVRYRNTLSGEEHEIPCEMVINAAGGWAQSIAAMAGVEVPIHCDKGTLLVLNHRLNRRVINRCRKSSDADILVPAGPVCILGTSSIRVPGPDGLSASPEEVDRLLRLGDEMIPGLVGRAHPAHLLRRSAVVCAQNRGGCERPRDQPRLCAARSRDTGRRGRLCFHCRRQAHYLSPDGRRGVRLRCEETRGGLRNAQRTRRRCGPPSIARRTIAPFICCRIRWRKRWSAAWVLKRIESFRPSKRGPNWPS